MKDLEKLKEYSLEELQALLIESLAEVVKPDIGFTRTQDLIKTIRQLRRVIKNYPEEEGQP